MTGPDAPELKFFPAMDMTLEKKLDVMDRGLAMLARHFEVVPMGEHAARVAERQVPAVTPRFTWS